MIKDLTDELTETMYSVPETRKMLGLTDLLSREKHETDTEFKERIEKLMGIPGMKADLKAEEPQIDFYAELKKK